jgi:transcriptional regulator with XRE-family HTH domain
MVAALQRTNIVTTANPYQDFGMWLRALRISKRLKVGEVADRLSVTDSSVSAWELGHYLPSLEGDVARKYARILGIKVAELRRKRDDAYWKPKEASMEVYYSDL